VVRDVGISFLVVELNDELVKQAQHEDVPVLFGDAARKEVLISAGALRARSAVVAISDQRATRTVVALMRSLNAQLHIIVRTRYVAEVDSLLRLGANAVIPEEFETSVEIFARVLERYGIPDHLIEQQVAIIRSGGYGMLRGLSLSQERLMKISELLLKSTVQQLVISEGSPAANITLRELNLRGETGATILVVIRGETANNNPDPDFRLEPGDVVVLWGAHQQLAEATRKLEMQPQRDEEQKITKPNEL
jgi:CPA2 family monovalent cation:H+ antiporter-2